MLAQVIPGSIRRRFGTWTLLGLLTVVSIVWLAPIIWVITMSLKPNSVLQVSTRGMFPDPFTLENYEDILNVSDVPRWFANSMVVATSTTILTLVLASLAGYAFARIPFKGKKLLYIFILSGMMVPEQAVFIPLHTMFSSWEMHNTYQALVLPRLAFPLGVFLMAQFFQAIPQDIEEASKLDGANRLIVYARIMMPLSIPALTTLGLFTFVLTWNDYLWPLVSATQTDMYTLTVGLGSLQGTFAQTEGLGFLMASAVTASAPILIVFVIFQRYIIQGVRMGGLF
jgi:multiple sugar transport system permease protein